MTYPMPAPSGPSDKPGFLLVANWDSDVGYAWWLMESFWALLAATYGHSHRVFLAYPSISRVPPVIDAAPIELILADWAHQGGLSMAARQALIADYRIEVMYFSDRPTLSAQYFHYKRWGVKTIITHDHSPGLRTRPSPLKQALKTALHRLPGLSADGCFGASDFVRSRLIEVNGVPPSRAFSVPNGLPIPQVDAVLSAPQPSHQGYSILTVGRANRYKGIEFALRAIAALKAEFPEIRYTLIGDGPNLQDFKTLADELGLSAHCRFLGRVDQVLPYLAEADLAFHPSEGEVGYCLAILDYMQAALPVVVPDNPSVCGATLHQQTGLHYPAGDLNAAVAALRQLLAEPERRRRYGEAGRHHLCEHFTLASTHGALLASVATVLGR